jgi:ABC-type nitrate/sulfonate/bicarbonate transport system ATPase subunit
VADASHSQTGEVVASFWASANGPSKALGLGRQTYRNVSPRGTQVGRTGPKLSIRGLTRRFTTGTQTTTAFTDLTFDLHEGEFVSIVGPSGCGKTTLLHCIAGLDRETSGTIAIDGVELEPAQRTPDVGYMFQKDLLLPWKRVIDNVALGLILAGIPRSQARERSLALMERYGLGGFARAYPAHLSGGMRQRAAVIRTLLVDRPIMLFDEPFGALDALTRSVMQEWLLLVWEERRRATIFVTHDIEEAVQISDRVLVMSSRPGRIVREVAIDIERPRTEEALAWPKVLEYKADLLKTLKGMLV